MYCLLRTGTGKYYRTSHAGSSVLRLDSLPWMQPHLCCGQEVISDVMTPCDSIIYSERASTLRKCCRAQLRAAAASQGGNCRIGGRQGTTVVYNSQGKAREHPQTKMVILTGPVYNGSQGSSSERKLVAFHFACCWCLACLVLGSSRTGDTVRFQDHIESPPMAVVHAHRAGLWTTADADSNLSADTKTYGDLLTTLPHEIRQPGQVSFLAVICQRACQSALSEIHHNNAFAFLVFLERPPA